jgi:putative transcriptional regulator
MSQETSLVGQFLIAMPGMDDERFKKSVVLIISYSDEGAKGLIINKPTDILSYKEIIEKNSQDIDLDEINFNKDVGVFYGGPVDLERVIILHSNDYSMSETKKISNTNCSITGSKKILPLLLDSKLPSKSKLFIGCSEWQSGQLESEIKSSDWLIWNSDNNIIFEESTDLVWLKVISSMGINIGSLSNQRGFA